jgi:DNA mismatch repair protein MSH6
VNTTRLLKAALPGACIWTSLRESEGFGFKETKVELKKMFGETTGDGTDADEGIPEAISSMLGDREAVEALGAMVWSASLVFSYNTTKADTR